MKKFLEISLCVLLSIGLASCYAPVNKTGRSSSTLDKPVTESQKAAKNYIALAFKYINANQMATARTKLEQAQSFESSNPRIYLGYALIYDKEQEAALADDSYKKAAALGGGSEVSMHHALSLYNLGRFNQAKGYFDLCMADTQYELRALCFELNGFNEMRLSNVQKAIGSFIKATQLNSNMPTSYLSLANLYIQTADVKLGFLEFKKYDQMEQYIDSVSHTAQSLWIGIQLANAVGESEEMNKLANQLKIEFHKSNELQIYKQWYAQLGSN